MRVLYLGEPGPEKLETLRELLPVGIEIVTHPDPETDVAIGGAAPGGLLGALPRLRWWIVPYAGIPVGLRQALAARPEVQVLNSHFNATDVAEHAWALLLAAAKRIVPCHDRLRRGDWSPRYERSPSIALRGGTLLLIGYGAIGRAVVPFARAFGMRVRAIRRTSAAAPTVDPVPDSLGTRDDLPRFLPDSDAILLSLPATAETDGFLGRGELECVKRGVLVVNVGRGASIDEPAFFEAMADGRIGAAGIDTWWVYPDAARPESIAATSPAHRDVSAFENLVCSPHRASAVAGREQARTESLAGILCAIAGGVTMKTVDRQLWY